MTYLDGVAVKIRNYKCFGKRAQGFEQVCPLNLIVGRNNSGKSALIDLIDYVTDTSKIEGINAFGFKGRSPNIFLTKLLEENEIRGVFLDNVSSGFSEDKDFDYGSKWIGKPITVHLHPNDVKEFVSVKPNFGDYPKTEEFANHLGRNTRNPFTGKIFKRIRSDRDINPERQSDNLAVSPNGSGATNMIQDFIHNTSVKDRKDFVERDLLEALNKIFASDGKFERIFANRKKNNMWEIYLEEEKKGRVPLSDSGSGLKTIILVLINLILIPEQEGRQLSDYIFGFEELENNLHPGLQRRLFNYISEKVTKGGGYLFTTTHSSAVIDLFSKNEKAQVLHITHGGEVSSVKRVTTHVGTDGVLDDLDVRASDLLQANCIIWVEGPSDRVYVRKWIDLWSNGELKEDIHYHCVFYGGKLLARLEAKLDEDSAGVNILRVNRKAIVIMDSDRNRPNESLGQTKLRIKSEVEKGKGLSWVTNGREIENYIPKKVFKKIYGLEELRALTKNGYVSNYLNNIVSGAGEKYLKNKVVFAEKVVEAFSKQDIEESNLDLKQKIDEVCKKVKEWNKIS